MELEWRHAQWHGSRSELPVPLRKGYYSEQILSSTLFRLYRSLGGDTANAGAPNLHARNEASHYTVYLIMRAIQILGTGGVVPANQPDQLVAALVQADVGTGNWNVKFPRPPSPSPAGAPSPATIDSFFRVGGCAHKVIRWAFEAQGLYAKLGAPTHGPGLPPPVDIYIPDRREPDETTPSGTIAYGPGHYAPVSLDWGTTTVPLWQATEAAIDVEGKSIHVKVGNRGTERANNVKIRLFLRGWAKGAAARTGIKAKVGRNAAPGQERRPPASASIPTASKASNSRSQRAHRPVAISYWPRRRVTMIARTPTE